MTPRKIVVIDILVLALSGVGFAVVEVMGPPRNRETLAAHGELIRQRVFGLITPEEADRRHNHLPTAGIVQGLTLDDVNPLAIDVAVDPE